MSIICKSCGIPVENVGIVISSEGEVYCARCASMFGTCAMCAHTYCGFFNDPDPMPQFKVIERKIRQGNAIFIEQIQVPNSDRIKKFCADGKCKCFLDDAKYPLCCRHGGYATCTNYKERSL